MILMEEPVVQNILNGTYSICQPSQERIIVKLTHNDVILFNKAYVSGNKVNCFV